jgi:hypothetical protein
MPDKRFAQAFEPDGLDSFDDAGKPSSQFERPSVQLRSSLRKRFDRPRLHISYSA